MGMTDPVADLLTRIRNVNVLKRAKVEIPYSKLKEQILAAIQREGFVAGFQTTGEGKDRMLTVDMKYGPDGEAVFTAIDRISKPGRRVYVGVADLKPVRRGFGIRVLSTHKGIVTDREARTQRIGGEVLCELY